MSQQASTTSGPDATPPGADAHGFLSHRQILVVLGGLMAGMFLAALDQSIVSTALPRITSDVGGLDKLSWVVTAYLLTSTSSTPLWGKISDLYGRRPMFQTAIGVFLLGSTMVAFSQNIGELIAFRAVQGIGGGGLMALALATIGDVIPPRERGRYQGYFGAVFGTSSVLGPVLGGFFADGPGWRWIFWINLPIGAVALVVTSFALKLHHVRRNHQIDYLGASAIVTAVSSLLLFTAWSGPSKQHGWTSGTSIALVVLGLVFIGLFVLIESRASEPIIPLKLFRNSVFASSNIFGFIIGFAMFGAIIFVPVYLQVVDGMSPTRSGLAMLPLVVGIFSTSISSGQIMTRTGRYKAFPVLGALTVIVALLLLSRLDASSPYWETGLFMYVLGAGLGFTMQIIVTVVQNAVDRRDMGTATSAVTFFRMMGGAFGTALFGAILTSRIGTHLAELMPAGAPHPKGGVNVNDVRAINRLPEPMHGVVVNAFADSLHDVFLSAVPVVVVALVVAFFIREVPLRTRGDGAGPGGDGGPGGESSGAAETVVAH